jgi:hypothetical protein
VLARSDADPAGVADVLGGIVVAAVAIAVSGPVQASLARLTRALVAPALTSSWTASLGSQ